MQVDRCRPPHGGRGLKLGRPTTATTCRSSPSAWGAWIETQGSPSNRPRTRRRPPHGGRGLKLERAAGDRAGIASPSAWGAWIETMVQPTIGASSSSPSAWGAWIETRERCRRVYGRHRRPPHGGRGLKLVERTVHQAVTRRPPHGGRGLKPEILSRAAIASPSPSAWGAWIETFDNSRIVCAR